MSLKSSIRKSDVHMNIPADLLTELHRKYDFYGGTHITVQPQNRMDSLCPKLI